LRRHNPDATALITGLTIGLAALVITGRETIAPADPAITGPIAR
jgi:hypothetical protein